MGRAWSADKREFGGSSISATATATCAGMSLSVGDVRAVRS